MAVRGTPSGGRWLDHPGSRPVGPQHRYHCAGEMQRDYDAVVVGGGIIGCHLALFVAERGARVLVVERESDLLLRASFANQARVHNGYHYPRSLLTALRSRVNFSRFVGEYADCIDEDFDHYYAVGRTFSKISPPQFVSFCRRIGAPVERAPEAVRALFNPALIADVFRVREVAFNADRLRAELRARLAEARVEVLTGVTVGRIEAGDGLLVVETAEVGSLAARWVFNCTYSNVNRVLAHSGVPPIPLRHELAELALVRALDRLATTAITVMDGPFFSIMPFPARRLHTLSHVRYTPHYAWEDGDGTTRPGADEILSLPRRSMFGHMVKDAQRYVPVIGEIEYVESMWEVKTLLPTSDLDDSRPILFKPDHGMRGLACVMGGKIDNVYDLLEAMAAWPEGIAA